VYVWNGTDFEYETDLGGLTIGLPPKVTANAAIPIPGGGTFYHKLSHAKFDDLDGIELHVREVVRELTFLDQLRLLVVDFPQGYEVWGTGEESVNEWGYVSPLEFYTSKDARVAIAATDHEGQDVTRALSLADNVPAPIAENDLVYYELDFGTLVHPENAKLIIEGWSIYAIRSTQDVQPTVEALDASGNWVTVKKFGAPYGDFKPVLVDLAGFLPTNSGRLRVNLGIENGARWVIDRVRFDESAPVPVQVATLDPSAATLVHGGRTTLSRCTYLSRGQGLNDVVDDDPDQYGYGAFTRYGDVIPLLAEMDDKFVVIRHGDQITLDFPGLAKTDASLDRSIFLQVDVTMKSFILGKGVEPLPFHGMSSYPYPSTESYPYDDDHVNFLNEYNTRVYTAP
jgi:hypothetical protein